MELVWLRRAQRELQNIFDYFSREAGQAVGSKLVLRILRSAELLTDFPRLENLRNMLPTFASCRFPSFHFCCLTGSKKVE